MSSRSRDAHGRQGRGIRGRAGGRRPQGDIPIERAREWISSYVYGNITVLSAAIAVGPEQISHGAAVWAVLATGLLTFVAHVLAHLVAHSLGQTPDERETAATRSAMRGVLITARPIASAAVIPALLYAAAWIGWLPSAWVQTAAIVVLAARIGFVGVSMQRFSGTAPTFSGLWSGVVLAVMAFAIGIAKVLLTH